MNKLIEIPNNTISTLNDSELLLLINIIPKDELLEIIKKNPKKFKSETAGLRLDIKSKILVDKLPSIYFNRVKKGDVNAIKLVSSYGNLVINSINDILLKETSNVNYYYESIQSNDIDQFANLINKILVGLKPENLRLYFKLRGHKLTDTQIEYLDRELPLILKMQEIKLDLEKHYKTEHEKSASNLEHEHKAVILKIQDEHKEVILKIQDEHNAIISKIQYDHKTFISKLQTEINDLNKQLKLKKQEIVKNENYINSLIESSNNEKNSHISKISELGNHITDMQLKIDQLTFEITQKIVNVEELENLNKSINEVLNLKYNEFSIIAMKQWQSKNGDLLKENSYLEEQCNKLKTQETNLNKELEILQNKINYLNNSVRDYIQNIDKKIIENAINTSMLKFSSNTKKEENDYYNLNFPYTKEGSKLGVIRVCDSIDTFAENLASNLEAIGIKNQSDEMANYIISILASGLVPLICGYNGRELANAISSAYCGEIPYIISLPNGYSNSKELTELYKKSKSNVVLIEDSIGTMNENTLLPLIREKIQFGYSNKILILSIETLDSLKFLPIYFYNYIALIAYKEIFISRNTNYVSSDVSKIFLEFSSNVNNDEEYKKVKKLLNGSGLDKAYTKLRSSVIAYSHKLSNLREAIQGYSKFELSAICKIKNMYEIIEKNIALNSRDFESTLFNVIKGDDNE